MLFYSYTIMRIQDFLLDDEFNPSEYAQAMQDLTENFIVKVGGILSSNDTGVKIDIDQIY
jgi:hypothetical protein